MANWADSIARRAISEMKVYSARGATTSALHLDANESPWTPPPSDASVTDYNRYPEQQPPALGERLAGLYGVAAKNIMMGRGSDEAIDTLVRTFCEAGVDSILTCPPTFGYFQTAADVQGVKTLEVPLNGIFGWDIDGILETIHSKAPKIVFLCSPNNPTGGSLTQEQVVGICESSKYTLVVVDEAYVEFSSFGSLNTLRLQYRNLVILRTLSKAYALAGVRMGVCIADTDVIRLLLKVLPPYPVARPIEKAVMKALAPATMSVHARRIAIWRSERTRLFGALHNSPFVERVYPSDANFLLMKISNIDGLLSRLAQFNVKIRDFGSKLPGLFRLSVGTPDENDIALAAFKVAHAPTSGERTGEFFRTTNETDIAVHVNIDNPETTQIDTGIGFFDHMLEQISKHGGMGLSLTCKGDLEIDGHHTIEDTALAFGSALKRALGDRTGIGRYGFVMPMDETQAKIAIDLSGRPSFTFKGEFPTDHVGEFAAEMCPHFFQSLSQTLGASIQIDVEGENTHHMIEACFKGVGRALRPALARDGEDIPSTKGVLS